MAPYYILSIDGGGIRGLITAILLERLEDEVSGFLERVNLFAGTSTGGLLALGLASGKTPSEARQLYEEHGAEVFSDTLLDDLRDLGSLIGADYKIEPLQEILHTQFGTLTLGDLPKKVLIATFDLDNRAQEPGAIRTWKAKFFHNFPGEDSDGSTSVVDVGLFTAAAPTFFPIVQGYVDGGVVATNPSMCALAQALHPTSGGQRVEDIVLLSLGTGHNPRFIDSLNGDWGLVQWAPHLVNLILEGSAGLADYQCRQIMGDCYHRLNPVLPKPIGMDRVSEIPLLRDLAESYPLEETIAWMKNHFDKD